MKIASWFLITLALLSVPTFAADNEKNEDTLRSLEWQKTNFETQLTSRLRDGISEAVQGKFIVNVAIELKPQLKAAPRAPGPKISDANLIPLGKLNLDSPIPQQQEKEPQQQRGFFQSIQKLSVSILLDSSIPDTRQDVIRKIVQNATDPIVGEGEAEISFDKTELSVPTAPERWSAVRWLVELKIVLSFIFGALILGLFGMLWSREYRSLEMKKISVLEKQYERALPTIESASPLELEENALSSKNATLALPYGSVDSKNSGVQKFRTLARVEREKALVLLKQWLRSGSRESHAALSALSLQLDTNELVEFLPALKDEERRTWKKIVDRAASRPPTAEVDSFISAQVLGALLSANPAFDNELVKKVSDLSFEDCLEIAASDTAAGAVLATLLPSSQLAAFYNQLPAQTASEIVESAMGMTGEKANQSADALSKAIARIHAQGGGRKASAPFADRVDDLLKNARPEQETAIFDMLAQSGDYALLRETVRQFFPAELIGSLPGKILKLCLTRYPVERQAEIIFCRTTDREALLAALGAPGSKARDLIEVELSRLENDEVRSKRVSRQSGETWREYVTTVRELLKNNEEARELASEVLRPWLESRGGSDAISTG
jgi:hypothetical protein